MLFTFVFSEDIYIFKGKDGIGALRSVSVKRDEIGPRPEWYLETVNHWAIVILSPQTAGISTSCFNILLVDRASC